MDGSDSEEEESAQFHEMYSGASQREKAFMFSNDSSVLASPCHSRSYFSPAFKGEMNYGGTPAGRIQTINVTPLHDNTQSIIIFESMSRM